MAPSGAGNIGLLGTQIARNSLPPQPNSFSLVQASLKLEQSIVRNFLFHRQRTIRKTSEASASQLAKAAMLMQDIRTFGRQPKQVSGKSQAQTGERNLAKRLVKARAYIYLYIDVLIYLFIYIYIYKHKIYLFIYLFILFIYLYIYLFIYLFIYSYIYLQAPPLPPPPHAFD